jgi:hypothetical protein
VLRIFARANGGETRTFEYREGDTVDGSMFAGWRSGNWGGGEGPGNGDDGQYQILQARYGTADQNVDVTQRLKELARRDVTFRLGNTTFGVDPAPGRVMTLRIYTRGPGGANRMFEYREGSVVDGSQFTGWGRGDWGGSGWNGGWGDRDRDNDDDGQYQILNARYGTADRNVDVTQRLKELARQDRTFRLGNTTFGVDPAPGRVMTLRIYTRGPGGANRMFEYREGSVVDGSQFTGWGRGDWGQGGWNGGWGDDDDRNRPNYPQYGEVQERDFGGGGGGRPSPDARCPGGYAAVGFHIQTGEYLNQAWLDCVPLRPDGRIGDEYRQTDRTGSPGGRAIRDARCRPGQVLRGLRGRTGASIDEMIGVCSSPSDLGGYDRRRMDLTNPVSIPNPGGRPAEAQCPSGSVVVGFRSRSGEWMDHLWVLCSEVRQRY